MLFAAGRDREYGAAASGVIRDAVQLASQKHHATHRPPAIILATAINNLFCAARSDAKDGPIVIRAAAEGRPIEFAVQSRETTHGGIAVGLIFKAVECLETAGRANRKNGSLTVCSPAGRRAVQRSLEHHQVGAWESAVGSVELMDDRVVFPRRRDAEDDAAAAVATAAGAA